MNAILKDLPPPLSAESELALFASADFDTAVLHSLRQAFLSVKQMSRGRIPDSEILSLSYSALTKAICNFKSGRGRFISYSKVYLKSEIARYWREKNVVRDSYRHETQVETEFPKPLESESVEPAWDSIHLKELWTQVEPVIQTLAPIEKKVIELRFKFSLTLEAAGREIGKSRERVRQIEATALKKLRAALSKGLCES